MERQEKRCWTRVFLLITYVSTFFWLQGSGRAIREVDQKQEFSNVKEFKRQHKKPSVHLLVAKGKEAPYSSCYLNDETCIRWMMQHSRSLNMEFKLDDMQTSVIVPKTGYYLINLRINYKVTNANNCQNPINLWARIKQFHADYPVPRSIISTTETMQCISDWQQTISLNLVEKIQNTTKLYVQIPENNAPIIVWGSLDIFFEVTFLQNSG